MSYILLFSLVSKNFLGFISFIFLLHPCFVDAAFISAGDMFSAQCLAILNKEISEGGRKEESVLAQDFSDAG